MLVEVLELEELEEELDELLELDEPQGPRLIHTAHSPLFVSGFVPCVHQRASYFTPLYETTAPPVYTAEELHAVASHEPPLEDEELEDELLLEEELLEDVLELEELLELEEELLELEEELLDVVPPQVPKSDHAVEAAQPTPGSYGPPMLHQPGTLHWKARPTFCTTPF